MPLFPGESDIDTLHHILKAMGNNLTSKHKKSFKKNPLFYGVKLPKPTEHKPLEQLVPEMGSTEISLLKDLLDFRPELRCDAQKYLDHSYFDPIRSSIDHEIKDLSELDIEDYRTFKKFKNQTNDEKQIFSSANDF